jgi:hypothetical protein
MARRWRSSFVHFRRKMTPAGATPLAIAWLGLWAVLITVGGSLAALGGFELAFRPFRRFLDWRRKTRAALDEHSRERLRVLEDAHTAWLDAASGCAGELSLMPRDPEWLRRQGAKEPTAGDYIRAKIGMRLMFGRANDSQLAALRRSTARVRALSPSDETQDAMNEAMVFLAEWGKWREQGWLARWPEVNARVGDAFRRDRDALNRG